MTVWPIQDPESARIAKKCSLGYEGVDRFLSHAAPAGVPIEIAERYLLSCAINGLRPDLSFITAYVRAHAADISKVTPA